MTRLIRWYARGADPADYLVLTAAVRWRVRAAALVQCCAVALAFLAVYFLWLAVVRFTDHAAADRSGPWLAIGASGAAAVGAAISMFGAYGISHFADVAAQDRIRAQILDTLGGVPLRWFITGSGGKTVDVVTAKVADIHAAVAHGRLEVIYGIGLPLAGCVWLSTIDWRLAVFALVPGAIVLVHAHLSAAAVDAERAVGVKRRADMIDAALEYVRDPALSRALLHTRVDGGGIPAIGRELEAVYRRVIGTVPPASRWAQHLSDPLGVLLATTLLGGWMTLAGRLDPGGLLAFVLVSGTLSAGLSRVQMSRWALAISYQSATEIMNLVRQPLLSASGCGDTTFVAGAPAIALIDVRFAYDDTTTALDGVSLAVEPGTTTAIVGASGAGKSTIVALLARFFEPESGEIRVNGVPLADLSPDELYRRVGFVLQRPGIVTASIADNIRLGSSAAGDASIHAAARQAGIHDRILELPAGYDSIVGADVALSGGEAQRIALARTLLNAPAILVLDEPTANVDAAAESALNATIKTVTAGRTTLVITHRLRSIVEADLIAVVDGGRIVATGTHAELLATSEVYRRQWVELGRDRDTDAADVAELVDVTGEQI